MSTHVPTVTIANLAWTSALLIYTARLQYIMVSDSYISEVVIPSSYILLDITKHSQSCQVSQLNKRASTSVAVGTTDYLVVFVLINQVVRHLESSYMQ